MGTLIIVALSNLATMFATAWLLHRKGENLPPVSMPAKVEVHEDEHDDNHQSTTQKGRNIL